jgi:Rrf2 family protein
MKLSTRTRYAIRAILQLADNFGNGPLQTRVIAKDQDISVKYLEQLMSAMKSAGLVKSQRGAKGGYVLSNPPNQIKLSDVFDVFEGSVVTVECVANENYCTRAADCIARRAWCEVQQAVKNVLQSITLQDALDKAKKESPTNYQI